MAPESAGPRLVFPGAVSCCDGSVGSAAAKDRAGKIARSEEICMVERAGVRGFAWTGLDGCNNRDGEWPA